MSASTPGVVIAAPASGSGKTLFTLGLLRALKRRGVAIASAKVGPDYIDPMFHAAASGRPCVNLDPWAMRQSTLASAAMTLASDATMIVCEGVMGLFDGAVADQGSTADVAARFGWPVVLIVDVRAQAASAAAVVKGFASLRDDVRIAGCVFNRVGSARHHDMLIQAMDRFVPEVTILGALPRDPGATLPERHLGLVQASEHADLDRVLDHAADLIERHVAVDALCERAASGNEWSGVSDPEARLLPPLGQRIAVASDVAYSFRYPLVIEGWRRAGAEIQLFSPLADDSPAADADAVYLPGGYPELYAGRLAGNRRFVEGLREAAARGATVFGECGGYMTLGEGLIDGDGHHHAMAGLLPLVTSFSDRRLHLGYRQVTTLADTPLGRAGSRFRGHEFHYATVVREGPGGTPFTCQDAAGTDLGATGLMVGSVIGSFLHFIDTADVS